MARVPEVPDDAGQHLGQSLTSYCFGGLSEAERESVEQHLMSCDACWDEFRRLEVAVRTLRFDEAVAPPLPVNQVVSLLGLSSRLDRPFGGHIAAVLTASAAFALLFAVPVLVEIAYQFDRFGAFATRAAPIAGLWIFLMSLLVFWVDTREVRRGAGFGAALTVLSTATVLLCAALLPLLPTATTVAAAFETYPVPLGYIKSVLYAWMVGPLFVFWPFHFVLLIQRELAHGRFQPVHRLLSGDTAGLPPRGSVYVRPWVMAAYLAGLFVFNYVGVNHLFENLEAGTYKNLFMGLVLVRVSVWMALAASGLWWYASCLIELKREAQALSLLQPSNGRRHAH